MKKRPIAIFGASILFALASVGCAEELQNTAYEESISGPENSENEESATSAASADNSEEWTEWDNL
mgnify:CR=1 FL=1